MNPLENTLLVSELREVFRDGVSQRHVLQSKLAEQRRRDGRRPVKRNKTVEEFLSEFWNKSNPVASGCIEWTGYLNRKGYGEIIFKRRHIAAHRAAYMIDRLEDPYPLFVCHKCDNPKCVNPDHHFLGTHLDNNRDRNSKGRSVQPPKGELHNMAKLKESEVLEIVRLRKDGHSVSGLARRFKVSRTSIYGIIQGKFWKDTLKKAA